MKNIILISELIKSVEVTIILLTTAVCYEAPDGLRMIFLLPFYEALDVQGVKPARLDVGDLIPLLHGIDQIVGIKAEMAQH